VKPDVDPGIEIDNVKPEPKPQTAKKVTPPIAIKKTVVKDGLLTVTTKPGCELTIDGGATFHTPIRGFKLAAGRHRLTIANAEHGIADTFFIDVAPGETEVVARDYSDRIKKAEPPKADPPKPDPPKSDGSGKDKTINPFAKKSPP
jgi:hypothetical protein